ncbi:siderophore ABC transporter substrate-binding protein [Roseibium aggregatum]|nr:siderophore ABC transporter substrate-binding protein [Roseibium aggregatum]
MPRTLLHAFMAALCALTALQPLQAEPVTVETARGPVNVAEIPKKIVVYDIAALDTLTALGVEIAGTPDNVYVDYLDEVRAAAEPVGTLFEPDFEAVYALQADLIVTGARSSKQTEALAELAPTIDMTISGDRLVEQARARLAAYGALFGKQELAAKLDADLQASIDTVKNAAKGAGKALIVLTNGPKISVYGPGSRFGWMHTDLGIEPASADIHASNHGEAVSFEFIRDLNPDWLLVVDRASAVGANSASAKATLDNQLVAETTAWKKGQVIYLDPGRIYISSGGYQALQATLGELADGLSGQAGSQ